MCLLSGKNKNGPYPTLPCRTLPLNHHQNQGRLQTRSIRTGAYFIQHAQAYTSSYPSTATKSHLKKFDLQNGPFFAHTAHTGAAAGRQPAQDTHSML